MTADQVADHAARRNRARALLGEHEAGAALVTRLVNVRYLTGFTGSNGVLLLSAEGGDLLVTDGRYADQAAAQAPGVELFVDYPGRSEKREPAAVHAIRGVEGARRVAFEDHDVTVALHKQLVEAAPAVELVSLGHGIEGLRTVKDDTEVAALRRACEISDQALADVLPDVHAGMTERELARLLEARMFAYGAEAVGFPTIVAGGPHSAIPHHRPTDRPLETGDLLKIDFGARYAGYHADETRTFVVGRPADWQRELYDLVAAAQRAGRDALRPGRDGREVDAASRSVIEDAGHGERFTHGLGHGVGLEVHEDPYLGRSVEVRLEDRIAVTVEPGVYLPGRGGVRIEDTLLVGADGAESLTRTDRALACLGG